MQKPPKKRIDTLLLERGLADTIEQARSFILAGTVYNGTQRLDKAGITLREDADITVKGRKPHPWVSRGGVKLAHGLEHFQIKPEGWVAIDVGCSTGGFTDVLLTHGAAKVYAVDVGYGELAWKLRQDPRVVVHERVNARYLSAEHILEAVDIVVCDASFIGLQTVLPPALGFLKPGGYLVALIKPQFEVPPGLVGEKGVVSDPALHQQVCESITEWIASLPGWQVIGITTSPIKGPEGNTEFLIGAQYHG